MSVVTDILIDKMGCTPTLSIKVSVKEIERTAVKTVTLTIRVNEA